MREDPWKLWTLVGLSFLYGVFHAAGPGHGKAVISSYMIANEIQLKRGIVISLISSFLQGVTAILVVGAAYLVLRGTSISLTNATDFLEQASYVLVAAFGAWLLVRKIRGLFSSGSGHDHGHHVPVPAPMLAPAHAAAQAHAHHHHDHHHHGHDHAHHHHAHGHPAHDHRVLHTHHVHGRHDHEHGGHAEAHGSSPVLPLRSSGHSHAHAHSHEHAHGAADFCEECGHAHMPSPQALGGETFSLKEAFSAVVAVGLRPCSGAIIVLTFSLLNSLYLGGILSVFAMSVGTAITVSLLAITAVSAKGLAVRLAGQGSSAALKVGTAIEIAGAFFVMAMGIVLFLATQQFVH